MKWGLWALFCLYEIIEGLLNLIFFNLGIFSALVNNGTLTSKDSDL